MEELLASDRELKDKTYFLTAKTTYYREVIRKLEKKLVDVFEDTWLAKHSREVCS